MTEELLVYKRMPLWTAETHMPRSGKDRKQYQRGNLKRKITVLKGPWVCRDVRGGWGAGWAIWGWSGQSFAQPQAWHRVRSPDRWFRVVFGVLLAGLRITPLRNGSNPVHCRFWKPQTVRPGRALDLGCGQRRNALSSCQAGRRTVRMSRYWKSYVASGAGRRRSPVATTSTQLALTKLMDLIVSPLL